jgi:hypothetical protein
MLVADGLKTGVVSISLSLMEAVNNQQMRGDSFVSNSLYVCSS